MNKLYNDDLDYVNSIDIEWEKLNNSKILITGATGLIGKFLVDSIMYRNKKYNSNITTYIISRNEEKIFNKFQKYNPQKLANENSSKLVYIIQNICDELSFDINFDYIIHGASNTHPVLYSTDPVGTITTNVIGFNNILKYSVLHKPKKILLMSTVEVYGKNRGDVDLFDEDYCGYINCNTTRAGYPESKRVCESLAQAYIAKHNLDISIGRLSRVYGPTMQENDSKAIAQFIKCALKNENIVLKSKGDQLFSFCYVSDVVSALFTILIRGKNGLAYNISSQTSDIKLKDLAQLVASLSDTKVIFETPNEIEKNGFSNSNKAILDSSRIQQLGWNAKYDIKNGVYQTIKILKK